MSGGAIGAAAGSLGSNLAATYFSNKAARSQARAYNDAYSQNQDLVNQAAGRLNPYYETGNQALSPLTGLLLGKQFNPETGDFTAINPEQQQAFFQKSPGYQFRLEQGQKALQNSQAARGGLLSGGALKELDQYSQGIASDEYGSYINQLMGLTGMGQQAATAQAGFQSNAIPGLTSLMLGGSMGGAMQAQNTANGIMSHHGDMMSIMGYGQGQSGAGASSGGGANSGGFMGSLMANKPSGGGK